jgi:4-hydroxy-tetrahydrodipicolinate synthase
VFRGRSAFPITAMDQDGRVLADDLTRLFDRLAAAKVGSVGLLGSTAAYVPVARRTPAGRVAQWDLARRSNAPRWGPDWRVVLGPASSGASVASWLRALPSAPIDQDCLLPATRRLVRAVNATGPTAGPLLPLQKFVRGPRDAPLPCRWPFRVLDPADELVSAERRQALPELKDLRVRPQSCLQIFTCLMDGPMRESVRHEPS